MEYAQHDRTDQGPLLDPFVEVGYEDKIVFVPPPNRQGRPDLHATWQQSQGLKWGIGVGLGCLL